MGTNEHNILKLKIMPSKVRLKIFEIKKKNNILFMLIITVQIFSLC